MYDLNKIDRSFSTLSGNKFVDLILCDSDKIDKKSDSILMSKSASNILKGLRRTHAIITWVLT